MLVEPLHLVVEGHIAVVEHHRVVGLAQGADSTILIGDVARTNIILDLLQRHLVALSRQLVVATLGTHLRVGSHKELDLGIGEDHRADIATVHHDTLVATHLLLHRHQLLAHLTHRADTTHAVAYLDSADLTLDQVAIDVDVAGAALGVEAEDDVDLGQQCHQRLLVDNARTDCTILERKEGHGAIHSSRIDKDISETGSQSLSEGTLAARRETIDCDGQAAAIVLIQRHRAKTSVNVEMIV